MNNNTKELVTSALIVLAMSAFFFLGLDMGNKRVEPQYMFGYCTALKSTPVTDSLCIRGDTVVARIPQRGGR